MYDLMLSCGGGGNKVLYIDHIYTTSTGGYTACVVGQSGVLDSSKGFTAGTSDDVRFDPWTTSGATDYGVLALSSTTFSYTPSYSGYYIDGTGNWKPIEAGTRLSWAYSVSKNMFFIFFDVK